MDAWIATRKSLRSSKRDRHIGLGRTYVSFSGLCRESHNTDRVPIPVDCCN